MIGKIGVSAFEFEHLVMEAERKRRAENERWREYFADGKRVAAIWRDMLERYEAAGWLRRWWIKRQQFKARFPFMDWDRVPERVAEYEAQTEPYQVPATQPREEVSWSYYVIEPDRNDGGDA